MKFSLKHLILFVTVVAMVFATLPFLVDLILGPNQAFMNIGGESPPLPLSSNKKDVREIPLDLDESPAGGRLFNDDE